MLAHCRRTWRRDDGVVLPAVVGVIALLTVVAFGGFAIASQAMQESSTVEDESKAFQAANAGADKMLARLSMLGEAILDDTANTHVTISRSELGSGEASVSIQPMGMYEYRIISDGTGTDGSRERVIVQLFYLNIYAMNINAGEQGLTSGGQLAGNSSIYGPFFARGTIAANGGFSVEKGPLFIKDGGVTLRNNSAHLGTSSLPIDLYCDGSIDVRNYYIRRLSRSVPNITLPRVDSAYLNRTHLKARDESKDNIMGDVSRGTSPNTETDNTLSQATYTTVIAGRTKASGASAYYKLLGPTGAPSAISAGSTGLTLDDATASFGRWSYDPANPAAAGTAYDDLAWDTTTNTLYVNGTVFVDGPLTLNCNILYKGNGVIVANGTITIAGTFVPAGGLVTDPDTGMANQNFAGDQMVGLVTPSGINITTPGGNSNKDADDPPDIAGALFCSQTVSLTNNVSFAGSIIANQIAAPANGQNPHIRTSPNLPDVLPESMPGRRAYLSTIGAWARQ